jgi:signal transduction histidine kinase
MNSPHATPELEMGIFRPTPLAGRCRSLVTWLGCIRRIRTESKALAELRRDLEEALERLQNAIDHGKAVEHAAELARARHVHLLAVVAHELRNPLAPMRQAAAILGCAQPGEALRARLIIERQIAQMSRMIDDLMDMSRASVGKLSLALEKVRLQDIVEHAAASCKPAFDRRRQRLLVTARAPAVQLLADPARLLQILVNLLDNASIFSPDCSAVYLEIQALERSVSIGVTDRGIGISSDALGRIFEPFMQEARAATFDRSGLGVGLAVVRELVEAHGGHVTVSSEGIGRGTCFVVTLPCGDAAPGESLTRA